VGQIKNWHTQGFLLPIRSYSDFSSFKTPPMTSISLTSGELMDVISALEVMENQADYNNDAHLASYYLGILQQFQQVLEKVQEKPGEKRVAHLVLAS